MKTAIKRAGDLQALSVNLEFDLADSHVLLRAPAWLSPAQSSHYSFQGSSGELGSDPS